MTKLQIILNAAAVAVTLSVIGGAGGVEASERRSTYTYDTSVLAPGERELEPWTTARFGRQSSFSGFDERLEFEMGVLDGLQTAWYLNFGASGGAGGGTQFDFKGVSWEWKYKLLDAVADPVGLGFYVEFGGGPAETELEAKVLLDKRIGNVHLALNAVGEMEWERTSEATVQELLFELDAAASWVHPSGIGIGLELRNHNEVVGGVWEHSAIFMGPTLSYANKGYWAALTLLPQIYAPQSSSGGGLELHEHERLEARLLFGWHI